MKKILVFTLLMVLSTLSFAQDHKMTATDINGKVLHITGTKGGFAIDEFQGKVVFLEFFGHNCPPCMKSIPHYISLTNKYKDKLAVVAIEAQGYSDSQLKEFVKFKGINYTVLSGENAGEFYQYASGRSGWNGGIPFLIALDPSGGVKFIQAGMLSETTLDNLVQRLATK